MRLENQITLIAAGSWDIGDAFARKSGSEGATCAIVAGTDIDHGRAAGMFIPG